MDYANLDQNSNRRGFKAKLLILASVLVIGTVAALAIGLASNHSSLPDNTITQLADPQLGYKLDLFDQWKTHHYKLYKEEEEAHRFNIWSANYDKVQEHHKNPKHTYTIELNEFADLSPQEWKEKIGYCHLNKPITRRHYAKLDAVNIPTAVDWRKKGAVTDVKNQLECGSCWAFSSTGALEGLNFILNGKLRSFSEQQLVDCSQNYGNNGCNGGLMDYAFEYVADKGIETEAVYPYRAKTGLCKYHQDKTVFSNKAYEDVPQGNNDALLAAVAQQPVSIGIEADTSVFQLYAGGVFNDASCGTNIDHGVLIVGFGTDPHGGDYWIVKNSWGGSWGENGYIRIARQSGTGAGVCGIAEAASYPTGQNKDAIDSLSKLLDIGKMNVNDIAPETGSLKDLFEGTPIAVHAINPIIPEVEEGSEEHAEEGAEEGAEEHAEEHAEEAAEEGAEEHAEEAAEEHAEETEFDEIFVLSDVGDRRINPIIPFLEEEAHEEEGAEANEEASEEENHEAENHEAESHEEESHEEEAEIHPHRKQGLAELLDAVQGHGL